MAIILQVEPNNELLAATYDTGTLLQYVVDITINTGSPTRPAVDPVLQVDFAMNGTAINTEEYNKSNYSYLGLNIHQYRFSFDAQENAQAYFNATNDPLLDLFRPLQSSGTDTQWHGILQLTFSEWLPDANNLLVKQVVTQTSSLRNIINAVIHHDDLAQNINQYDNQFLAADANWLTDKPQSMRIVCRDDDEQLAGWNMGIAGSITGMTFTGYDASGAVIAIGAMANIPALQNGITVFPVGPQNITNATGWSITPAVLPSSPTMKRYKVKISFANKSIEWTYYLKNDCCDKYRLYFKNRFGFYDTIDIEGMDVQTYTVNSVKYEQQKDAEYVTIARGASKVISLGKNDWAFAKIRLTAEQAEFMKQLVLSPMVYMQTQKYSGSSGLFLRPVIIEDAAFDTQNNIDKPVEFSFKVTAANTDKSQRN